jgi:hypothetical protein
MDEHTFGCLQDLFCKPGFRVGHALIVPFL